MNCRAILEIFALAMYYVNRQNCFNFKVLVTCRALCGARLTLQVYIAVDLINDDKLI